MSCTSGIGVNIASTCENAGIGGMEVKAWIMNRSELTGITYDVTNPSKVTVIDVILTKKAFTITGFKKNMVAGFDLVASETMPNKYTHYLNWKLYQMTAAQIENMDAMEDVVVVYESKDKESTGDGVFRILGLQNGLYKTTATMRTNADNGTVNIEMASMAGEEEDYPQWTLDAGTYDQTKAMLVALETTQV